MTDWPEYPPSTEWLDDKAIRSKAVPAPEGVWHASNLRWNEPRYVLSFYKGWIILMNAWNGDFIARVRADELGAFIKADCAEAAAIRQSYQKQQAEVREREKALVQSLNIEL